ncbi:MAG: ABC transporter permease, partial [Hyphomicrobiaceae bacterium]
MRDSTGTRLKTIWMAPKLAFRNLFHDVVSLTVTLTGIVFSVVLVAVQCGLYLGSERTIAAVLDQVKADLWIVPIGTKSFDDPAFLNGREKYAALSTRGVAAAEDLMVGFASWRKPKGGSTAVLVVGSDWTAGGLSPWNIQEGSLGALEKPDAVAADRTYFTDLGINGLDDRAEINGRRVKVAAVTHGIRSFTTLPYIFTTLPRAESLLDASPGQASYALVRVTPGANIDDVRARLSARLPDVEVLTHDEFR